MASASFKVNSRRRFDFADDPDVLTFAASEAARGMSPYVPFKDGILDASATASATASVGKVTYRCHYAVYNFYGTDRRFRKDGHPNASAFWHEPYKEAHGDELALAVGRYVFR